MIKRKAVKLLINVDKKNSHSAVLSRLMKGAARLECSVAFAKISGLGAILPGLKNGLDAGLKARVVVGLDFYLTDPELLRTLLKLAEQFEKKLRFYVSKSEYTFHPKIYAISGKSGTTVLIGSANLTGGGMLSNHEASAQVDDPDCKLMNAVTKHLDQLVDDGEVIELTHSRLDEYERLRDVYRLQQKLAEHRFNRMAKSPRAILETLQDVLVEMKRDLASRGFEAQRLGRNQNLSSAAVGMAALAAAEAINPTSFLEHYEQLIQHFHSSGLHRGKNIIAKKSKNFQRALQEILKSKAETPEEAYKILLDRFLEIPKAGVNVLTEILHAIDHKKFAVMNKNAVSGLRLANFSDYPEKPSKTTVNAAMYAAFCRDAAKVRDELGLADFTELDALFDYAYW